MKKTLLIGAVLMSGVTGFAQNNRQAANHFNKTINTGRNSHLIEGNSQATGAGTKRTSHSSASAICSPPNYTSGPNAFGVGGGVTTYKQNCIAYNKDLNSYLFMHRRSATWATTNTMSSGNIQGTWMNMTTGVKDSAILYYEATALNPARYPSGAFYNPAGNTDLNNTYIVGAGPDLPGNGGFTGPWYSARKLSTTAGANQVNPGVDLNFGVAGNPTTGSSIFLNYDMQQVGTKVLVGGEASDTTTSANANHITAFGGVLAKCDFSTGSPVWSYDSIIPGLYFNRDGAGNGYASDGEGGRFAFGPDQMTGYWVQQGRLATTYNNSADSSLYPVVFKTTDGGSSWALVMGGYDWASQHPELGKNVGQLTGNTWKRSIKLSYKMGYDVTVDANNVLHLVGSFEEGVPNADSVAFGYTYAYDNVNYHPIIWDLMTDGSCWKTLMVDSTISAYVGGDPASDTTAAQNPIGNAGTFLPYGARIQVARSSDGKAVIYSWADSDPSSTGSAFNIAPDLIMKAYDVTTNKLTATTNVTNGIGTCWFHMMADVAYFDANSKWTAPCVYTVPRVSTSGVYDGTAASDHFWMDCGSFGAADFTINASVNDQASAACYINVKSNKDLVSTVGNFPNPFSTTTNIVVNLNDAKSINLQVMDAIGNVVAVKNVKGNVGENTIVFDAAGLNAGVYFYTVTAGHEKTTKKMVIQK